MKIKKCERVRPLACRRCQKRQSRWRRKTMPPKPVPRLLTDEQVQRLIDAADPRIKPAIMAMALMGLRPGEVGLVDWSRPVQRSQGRCIAVPHPKRYRIEWKVVPDKLWAEIGKLDPEHRDRHSELSRAAQALAFRRLAEAAGHKNLRLYDLRRYWFSRQRRGPL